jgi:nucleoside-diphosphate-sugar epimerase
MKVFVTGATGVLGRPAVARMIAAGHEVRGVARSEEAAIALKTAGAEPVDVDLFDPHAVREAVVGSDVIAHLATHVPPFPEMLKAQSWELHNRLRTDATRNLVDAARAAGIPRFIKESITIVYADGGPEWLDERSPLIDGPALNAPAIQGEQIALELAGDSSHAVVLRFGLFYGGEGNRGTDEMLRMARWHLSMIPGKSWAFMSSIHVDDAAAAVLAALSAPSGIYNVTDDEPLTRGNAMEAFAQAFGTGRLVRAPHWTLKLVGGAPAASMTASQRVSNRKFEAITGWSPQYRSQVEGWKAEHARLEAGNA